MVHYIVPTQLYALGKISRIGAILNLDKKSKRMSNHHRTSAESNSGTESNPPQYHDIAPPSYSELPIFCATPDTEDIAWAKLTSEQEKAFNDLLHTRLAEEKHKRSTKTKAKKWARNFRKKWNTFWRESWETEPGVDIYEMPWLRQTVVLCCIGLVLVGCVVFVGCLISIAGLV